MKVIIAGPRDLEVPISILDIMITQSGFNITEVVSGGAFGMDHCGEEWAIENNISISQFLPDWNKYGKSAGPRRNKEMADYADALLIVKTNKDTSGTKNMILTMQKNNKPIHIEIVDEV